MTSLEQLRRLVVDEQGLPKRRTCTCVSETNDNGNSIDVSGVLSLMKIAEDLTLSIPENTDNESIIKRYKNGLFMCQAVLDRVWEKLNTGLWKDVPLRMRHLYSHASLLKAVIMFGFFHHSGEKNNLAEQLRSALKSVDYGILLGMPTSDLTVAAQILSQELKIHSDGPEVVFAPSNSKKMRWEKSDLKESIQQQSACDAHKSCQTSSTDNMPEKPWRKWRHPREIPALERPSLEKFFAQHFLPKTPVILKGCLQHWPALSLWCPSYLARIAGERTVPIEIGPNYVHPAWGQKLMAVGKFVERYMPSDASFNAADEQIGYLAQHPLFDQVPELRNEIKVPEYCCLSEDMGSSDDMEKEPDLNAWFGPKGTVSPLHYDPKHNLLAQVVGNKRVILYSSKDSKYLHPYEGQLLRNTSQVDPEDSKTIERFPDVTSAEPWECEIQAGDMLYIPQQWWHHVRSLSTSFSVSFWW